LINQYLPPDPAPTGTLLKELGDALEADGHQVDYISARQDYRAGQKKGRRMLRELNALGRMLVEGLKSPRPDLVISESSPPCLLVPAMLIAARHGAKSIHWVMDLYPEIGVATGVLSQGWFLAALQRLMGWCYRRCARVVALDEDMVARLDRYGVGAKIIRPWVFQTNLEREEPLTLREAEEPWTWVYSGNLGRAHEWETFLEAQRVIEQNDPCIRLRFQGGGPLWSAAQARAEKLGLERCEFVPYVPRKGLRESLLRGCCCAASQRPAAQGMIWPSKLNLLLTLPRPLLWVGPAKGAISRYLRTLPHAGVFVPGEACEIAAWLVALSRRKHPDITPATDASADRAAALDTWRSLVRETIADMYGSH
jgi:hypothetical protein